MPNYQSKYKGKEVDSGVAGGLGAVRFDIAQSLTEEQTERVHKNIGLDTIVEDIEQQISDMEYTGSEYIDVDNEGKTIRTTLHAGDNVMIGLDGSINVISPLPNTPEVEGKYALTGTLSDDTFTLSWDSESEGTMEKSVKFISYDGTVICEYSKDKFLSLSEMPVAPSVQGMTFQGWNWTLADAKAYVLEFGGLLIGATYITNDGKTRLYVTLEEGRLHPYIGFGINGTATIDWGDGSEPITVIGDDVATVVYGNHEYAEPGDYVIVIDGQINIKGANSINKFFVGTDTGVQAGQQYMYLNCVKKIELGNIYGIDECAFYFFKLLRSINIPSGLTTLGKNAFAYCWSLTSIVIPNTVTTLGESLFSTSLNLQLVAIPNTAINLGTAIFSSCSLIQSVNLPSEITSIGNSMFSECNALRSIEIPNGVTSIGNYAFYNCKMLQALHLPEGVTRIGDGVFNGCVELKSINIPEGITSIGTYAFQSCRSLTLLDIPDGVTTIGDYAISNCAKVTSITIPDTVTSIGENAFQQCYSFTSITIPSGVTTIKQQAFRNCAGLCSVTIGDTVTALNSYVFGNCYGLGEIHFTATTPPTCNANAFSSLPVDCKIYVPTDSYDAYTTATNYPSPSTYEYIRE